MRCIVAVVIDNRYRYYVSAGTFSDDRRDAYIFTNSVEASRVANVLRGVILDI